MTWEKAIEISDTDLAIRKTFIGNTEKVYLRFRTGPNFELTFVDGKNIANSSREVPIGELEGFDDWEPSIEPPST